MNAISTPLSQDLIKKFSNSNLKERFSAEALNHISDCHQEANLWSESEIVNRGLTESFNYLDSGRIDWNSFFLGVTETPYCEAYTANKEQACILAVDLVHIAKEFINDTDITQDIDNSAAQRILAKHHSDLIINNDYLAKAIKTLIDNNYFFNSRYNNPDCEYSIDYIFLEESLLDLGI